MSITQTKGNLTSGAIMNIIRPIVVSVGISAWVTVSGFSEQIKAAITVPEFVGQYVDLSGAGRGHCPFHDDRNRSFSVNAEKNYWHCFAGCGGGSVIDFWMMFRKTDFRTSICELAEMLGV